MKKKLSYILGTGLVVMAFAMPVAALESMTMDMDSTTDTTMSDTAAARDERIAKRKAELQTKLAAAEETRLKGRCQAAQTVIGNLYDNVAAGVTARVEAYQQLPRHITDILAKLESTGLDLEELKSNQAQLMVKVNAFESDVADYQQILSDMKAMDCTADVTGFKASLETARTARESLATAAKDIKAYINDTVKVTLKSLRTQLADNSSMEEAN